MGRLPAFIVMCALYAATSIALAALAEDDPRLEEIIVTASLRPVAVTDLPGSVTVLTARTLKEAGRQHFEEVLALVPDINWAGDTARPRYFQIRGIGELQQYQGAPNPSVGFLIDDIDFSGLGSAATLFDVDHIEILRGPQGTLYGANALAGLIYVKSAEPADTLGGRVELDAGSYHERSYGAVLTGPVAALGSAFRLAVQRSTSDGFYHNAYLARHDTGRRDELTLRARWRYDPSDHWRMDFSLLRVQINDGYDAFAIDNSRTTQSDHPGVDRQNSTGLSAHATYTGLAPAILTAIATAADTTVNYGFDGDWGNPRLWSPYTYDYTELQIRHRSTRSLELRLGKSDEHGLSWLTGAYAFELREGLSDTSAGSYNDPFDPSLSSSSLSVLSSRYRARSSAIYSQFDGNAGPGARWSVGVRGERRHLDYTGATTNLNAPTAANGFSPSSTLWGGHASLEHRINSSQNVYALISRGYKAGGFNLSPGLPQQQINFAPESDLNFEIGHKARTGGGKWRTDTALFYMTRRSEQLLTSDQLDPTNPNTFIYFTGNAASGVNYGLESTFAWEPTAPLKLGGSLGILRARYHGFVQNGLSLPDRALPHAPRWQAAADATWRDSRGPYARVDVTAMGGFYYDLPPNGSHSKPYGLLNGKIGWEGEKCERSIWGRNLLDKNYTVRGFYFGNEPPDFTNKLYTQLGEPRTWGVHFTLRY